MIQPLWRTVWRFLKKLKIEFLCDPAIPLLGIYPEKTTIQKDICTPVFIAALFTIARSWKQPKCPSTEEWIKKMWYIYIMEYYSAIKSNEIGSFVETWMDLETVIQSKVRNRKTNIVYLPIYVESRKMVQMTGLQGRNRDTDVENKCMDTKGGKEGVGGGMNWETGIDTYTLTCIK